MNVFAAWILDGHDEARRVESTIAAALARADQTVDDGVLMSWPQTGQRPQLRPLENVPRSAALGDPFWGLCFGALFFAPLLTAVDGDAAAENVLSAVLDQVGVSIQFRRTLRTGLTPDSAAFVLLCDTGALNHVGAALSAYQCSHIHASVSDGQLEALHAT